jgi:putative FmdB family regulatory protein
VPVYEFICHSCQKDFELLCPVGTEVNEVSCPVCQQKQLTKKFSVFGIISKNSESGASGDAGFSDFGENSEGSMCSGPACGGLPGSQGMCGSSGCGCE